MKLRNKVYSGFGIRIRTPFPLNELRQGEGKVHDVEIRPGRISDSLVESLFAGAQVFENRGGRFRFSPRAICFEWDRVGRVLIRDGTEVIVQRDASATLDDLSPFLTGPVLAAILHQRKFFVLHASSIGMDGAAVVFVGPKGHGKSTLAAHLKVRGHRMLSDDIVPLRLSARKVWTEPGFSRVKLYDDSIEAIGASPTDFPTVHRFAFKRSLDLPDVWDQSSVPLCGIYILNENREFDIVEINKARAFIEVIKNAHLGRFLVETGQQSSYFELCKAITSNVPVFRLDRPDSFAEMPRVLADLERHIQMIAGRISV